MHLLVVVVLFCFWLRVALLNGYIVFGLVVTSGIMLLICVLIGLV